MRTNPDTGLTLKSALEAGRAADKLRSVGCSDPNELLTVVIDGVEVRVPGRSLMQFVDILDDAAEGRESAVARADLVVGTAEAARHLGVSRPWVAELIDRGELAGTKVGSKRRVRLGDLVERRRATTARQLDTLDELADLVDEGEATGRETVSTRRSGSRTVARRRTKPKSVA